MKNGNHPSAIQFAFSSVWPRPSSRDFAELSDPILFAEVLEITHKEGSVSLQKLTSETEGLRRRLHRLWVIDIPKRTTIKGLLSALTKFGWLKENGDGTYGLTPEGSEMYKVSSTEKEFRRLIQQLYKYGNKIELFARRKTEGWETYGNECA